MKQIRLLLATVLPLTILILMMATLRTEASPTATFTVNSTVDAVDVNPGDGVCETAVGNGVCTLRAAVMETNALAGNDNIAIPANTYVLTIAGQDEDANASGDIDITDGLVIDGAGSDTTIIDGAMLDRVFHITDTNNISVTFSNLTIQNGGFDEIANVADAHGGGVYNALPSNSVIISDAILLNNEATGFNHTGYGGAIHSAGSMQISNSNILSNTSFAGHGLHNSGIMTVSTSTIAFNRIAGGGGPGGTIYNDGSLFVDNAEFYDNYSYAGGGVHNSPSGIATLDNVNIHDNTVYLDGGAFFNFGTITLTNSTIYTNSTTSSRGGGIFNVRGNFLITDSTIGNNEAMIGFGSGGGLFLGDGVLDIRNTAVISNSAKTGGGIYIEDGEISINNSTISYNTVTEEGGGIYNLGQLEGTNLTISNNEADVEGGGIWHGTVPTTPSDTITLTNATLVDNSAPDGSGIYLIVSPSASTLSVNNTILANNSSENCNAPLTATGYSLESGNSCGLINIGDIINIDPLLGPLQDNGGSTMTHALLAGSPAVDTGDDISCPSIDQRGVERPFDGDENGTAVCDIGAFEYGSSPLQSIFLPLIVKP